MNGTSFTLWDGFMSWLGHPDAELRDSYLPLRVRPQATDVSARLKALIEPSADRAILNGAFGAVADRLRQTLILFVPAYLSGPLISLTRATPGFDFLHFQLRRLRREGFDASIAGIDSVGRVEDNAAKITKRIVDSEKPVTIVAHSKGGVDALHALISDPSLLPRVAGLTCFQSPFFGTPLADLASMSVRARDISRTTLSLFGGKIEALLDLTTEARARYMKENAAAIGKVLSAIPVLSIPTTLGAQRGIGLALVRRAPTTRWLDDLGLANDGVVPLNCAILPGGRYAALEGLFHAEPASRHPFMDTQLDRVDLLKAALSVLLGSTARSE